MLNRKGTPDSRNCPLPHFHQTPLHLPPLTTTGWRKPMKVQKRPLSSTRARRTACFSVSSISRHMSVTSCMALSSWGCRSPRPGEGVEQHIGRVEGWNSWRAFGWGDVRIAKWTEIKTGGGRQMNEKKDCQSMWVLTAVERTWRGFKWKRFTDFLWLCFWKQKDQISKTYFAYRICACRLFSFRPLLFSI